MQGCTTTGLSEIENSLLTVQYLISSKNPTHTNNFLSVRVHFLLNHTSIHCNLKSLNPFYLF